MLDLALGGTGLVLDATVTSTLFGTVRVVDADTTVGRVGGDEFTVLGGAGPDSLLVLYGDTTQDGIWYSGDPATAIDGADFGPKPHDAFPNLTDLNGEPVQHEDATWIFGLANPYAFAGNDLIDASALFAGLGAGEAPTVGVIAYGGPGEDTIYGSQTGDHLAGGSGDDHIEGGRGIDLIYGDSGFNVDPLTRVLTVPTANASDSDTADLLLVPGDDTLLGEGQRATLVGALFPFGTDNSSDVSGNGAYSEFDDVIFGDHGAVIQDTFENVRYLPDSDARPQKIETTLRIDRIESREAQDGGDDTIHGELGRDRILGGAGSDTISGDADRDIILGDNGHIDYVSIDAVGAAYVPSTFADTANRLWVDEVATEVDPAEVPLDIHDDVIAGNADDDTILGGLGNDTIAGNDNDDLIFGDHGVAVFVHVIGQGYDDNFLAVAFTTNPAIGGNDTITGDTDDDLVLGGNGADRISGGSDVDIVLGDNGVLLWTIATDRGTVLELVSTMDPTHGGNDLVFGDADNDILLGGTADDVVSGGTGNDLTFGDHGMIAENETPITVETISRLPFNEPLDIDYESFTLLGNPHPFIWTSIDAGASDGGGVDLVTGDAGEDVIIGGQAGDYLLGGTEDDDIIGGHNVAGGYDGDDTIDAGSQDDVVAADNADLLRTGSTQSPRFRTLSGTLIYQTKTGDALVTRTNRYDPRAATVRHITLFDHSFDAIATPEFWGDDAVAGGADDDVIFGQLGDDNLQGDGFTLKNLDLSSLWPRWITDATWAISLLATVKPVNRSSLEDHDGPGRDGDDWVEGNGGDDTVFGNLGQDDLLGDSSSLFSLIDRLQRPTGDDLVFGGAGGEFQQTVDLLRNNLGDLSEQGHARDADVILGDNANIYRLVGTNGQPLNPTAFLTFAYDTYGDDGTLRIIPRAFDELDYTQGGSEDDLVGDDLVHGEAGDDTIHGMGGNDVLFGEGQDDDIYGGTGFDRVYAGSGIDGVVGDDGKILTSRNGTAEPLNNRDEAIEQSYISIPGPWTGQTLHITGTLQKEFDSAAWDIGWADIIYGGLGDDFLHGGAGDDAMSGAEATRPFYNELPQVDDDPLGYDPITRKLAAYDALNPREKIPNFLLNFDSYVVDEATGVAVQINGVPLKSYDGCDRLFGDNGNDWLVGGTMCDWMFGGAGDDLMNLDDFHETNGNLNNRPEDDRRFADADYAFGGAGLDVLIANTAADRMWDWSGEFNSFIVPFSPFGAPTVNRTFSPWARDFLRGLGYGAGEDRFLVEPDNELALVEPEDGDYWKDQKGGPRDPQPGNIPGTQRDDRGGPDPYCPPADHLVARVEKAINATNPLDPSPLEDADVTGPVLDVDTPVEWTYLVRNNGLDPFRVTSLRDDAGTPDDSTDDFTPVYLSGDDNGNDMVDPGETWLYTSAGVRDYAVVEGTYRNLAVLVAEDEAGNVVTDDDPNVHTGTRPAFIDIEKAVNAANPLSPSAAEDADTAPGVTVQAGSTVIWTYLVRATGAEAMTITAIWDDNGTPGDDTDDIDLSGAYVSGDANGNGVLDVGELWLYRLSGSAVIGAFVNVGYVEGTLVGDPSVTVSDMDAAHYLGSTGIRVEKAINAADPTSPTSAEDADSAPGPTLVVGTPVVWTYLVFGESALPLSGVVVTDSEGFTPVYRSGDDGNGLLEFGEVWLFTSDGVVTYSVVDGPYLNTATVTALSDGVGVTDTDPNHHTGVTPGVDVEKAVNAVDPLNPSVYEDADTATGPNMVAGTTVTWTYLVRARAYGALILDSLFDNAGTPGDASDDFQPTAVVTATGLNVGDLNEDRRIDPGEVWLFRATGIVVTGQYRNEVTVVAHDVNAPSVTFDDSDSAHYFGHPRELGRVTKAVNAVNPTRPTLYEDANNPSTPVLLVPGSPVVWTYLVSNPTNDFLRIVSLRDDNGTPGDTSDDFTPLYVSGDTNDNGRLDKSETWLFTSAGVRAFLAPEGLYGNLVTLETCVVGSSLCGVDDDPAFLFGVVLGVDVEKATNGEDADTGYGPTLIAGSDVTWTYVVRNTGNHAGAVTLVDDNGTPDEATDDFAPSYLDGDTNGNGLLDLDEVWTYTAASTAVVGQYRNLATITMVEARTALTATDSDPSAYYGLSPSIRIEKAINAADPWNPTAYEDADTGPGPAFSVGTEVVWTYLVTNTGDTPLSILSVMDLGSNSGWTPIYVDGDQEMDDILSPGETWLFESPVWMVVKGPYTNTATVEAITAIMARIEVSDTDDNHHIGTLPGIVVEKYIEGPAGNSFVFGSRRTPTPDLAVVVPVGDVVRWTYKVTTPGESPLEVVLVDDNGTPGDTSDDFEPDYVSGDTDGDGWLDAGETWLFASFVYAVIAGDYVNVARVTGTAEDGSEVRDDDINHHFGADPGVRVTKAINAIDPWNPTEDEDAQDGRAPEVAVGSVVVFSYLVTNTGNVALTIGNLVDDNATPSDAADDFVPVYSDGDYGVLGVLDPGETWLLVVSGIAMGAAEFVPDPVASALLAEALIGSAPSDGNGANTSGPYDPTNPGAPSENGNGDGNATGRPGQGTVGNADIKNPPGQVTKYEESPDAGYECDDNNGVGKGNPAHTGCSDLVLYVNTVTLLAIWTHPENPEGTEDLVFSFEDSDRAAYLTEANVTFVPEPTDEATTSPGGEDTSGSTTVSADASGTQEPQVVAASLTDATVLEGDSGTTAVPVTLTLAEPSTEPVTLTVTIWSASATAGEDFVAETYTVTLAPGQTEVDLYVTVLNDKRKESDETIVVDVSDEYGRVVATSVVTVKDDAGG